MGEENGTFESFNTYPMSEENLNGSAVYNQFHYTGDDCIDFTFQYVDLTQIFSVEITFICAYVIVIILSVVGNALVIWTVIRNRHMRTVTNFYILNLAIADMLVSMCVMPLKLLEYTAPCHLGIFKFNSLCSLLYFILPVFVFTSVLTLMAMSLER